MDLLEYIKMSRSEHKFTELGFAQLRQHESHKHNPWQRRSLKSKLNKIMIPSIKCVEQCLTDVLDEKTRNATGMNHFDNTKLAKITPKIGRFKKSIAQYEDDQYKGQRDMREEKNLENLNEEEFERVKEVEEDVSMQDKVKKKKVRQEKDFHSKYIEYLSVEEYFDLFGEGETLKEILKEMKKTKRTDKELKSTKTQQELKQIFTSHLTQAKQRKKPAVYTLDIDASICDESMGFFNLDSLSTPLQEYGAKKRRVVGVTHASMYFGTLGSGFPMHIEDQDLLSINYLHAGKPKMWVIIPRRYIEEIKRMVRTIAPDNTHSTCPGYIKHRVNFPSLELLDNWVCEDGSKIIYKVIEQQPGDFIVVDANCLHFGINCGNNICSAVNFCDSNWIQFAKFHVRCTCGGTSYESSTVCALNHLDTPNSFREKVLLLQYLKGFEISWNPYCNRYSKVPKPSWEDKSNNVEKVEICYELLERKLTDEEMRELKVMKKELINQQYPVNVVESDGFPEVQIGKRIIKLLLATSKVNKKFDEAEEIDLLSIKKRPSKKKHKKKRKDRERRKERLFSRMKKTIRSIERIKQTHMLAPRIKLKQTIGMGIPLEEWRKYIQLFNPYDSLDNTCVGNIEDKSAQ